MLQAERDTLVAELQSRGRMRRVEKLHFHRVQKRQPGTSENDQQEGKLVVQEEIPNSEQELAEWMCTKHLEFRDALEIGPNELVVERSQLVAKGALAMQAFSVRPSTVSNIGHVTVRFLRQWRPVLSRYGMRGVCVGEASNPGPVTTRSASRILPKLTIPGSRTSVTWETRPTEGRDVRPRRGRRV